MIMALCQRHLTILLLLATLALTQRCLNAQRLAWSLSDGEEWFPWDTSTLVERCSLDPLHVHLDGTVVSSAVFSSPEHPRRAQNGHTVRMPMEIVLVEGGAMNDVILTTAIDATVTQTDLPSLPSSLSDAPPPPPAPVIECAFDTAFCIPKIVGIRLPDVIKDTQTLQTNHTIVLLFADATTRPDVRSLQDLQQFVVFTTYIGDEVQGAWQDDKTLVLYVTRLDDTRVLAQKELMAALVQTTLLVKALAPRPTVVRVHADVTIRVEPRGRFALRLGVASSLSSSFAAFDPMVSPEFRVKACDDSTNAIVAVSDRTLLAHGHTQAHLALPKPAVLIDGVLTHSGNEPFTIRHSVIAMEDPGSWSINLWLFTQQKPTGSFRTLLFNGDGNGQHRTPSAWFRPHDQRLVLRVSTVSNMDIGLDSTREIPLNEWVNIGFTFRNCSTSGEANATVRDECRAATTQKSTKPWFYSIRLVVNGKLDQEIRIFSPVLPNRGPFHVAKGPWTDGMAGFTSQLRVYSTPVDDEVHSRLFKLGRLHLHGKFEDQASCAALEQAQSTLVPPSKQIAYWSQCTGTHTSEPPATGVASEAYEHAMRLLAECDSRAWDFMVEAAELGDTRAMRHGATATLYGRLPFPKDCAKAKLDGIRVEMDTSEALRLLFGALRAKNWSAARSLALLGTITDQLTNDASLLQLRLYQMGLYHLAAASGSKEAYVILGRLYSSPGAVLNHDVAAYYYAHAANAASVAYHARGKQPLHEMNRLYDGIHAEDDLRKGQLGDDDELIQYQKMRADKDGDVNAMFNMGDLYYWGARGLERDHDQAYRYFHNAAQQGHTGAQSAVAGMLLKGEGTQQDNSSAIGWYTKAAEKNHTRALNGLGFMHFYGSGGMEENKTLALEYFERAAANLEDADSVFNAGYCYAFGLGTKRNLTRAMEYYDTAARRFGHFDAIHELGKIYWTGDDSNSHADDGNRVDADAALAIKYFKAASDAGTWGSTVRTGFELFLAGQFERAAIVYHEATEYGYPVATSNLAYLYDQKLFELGDVETEKRALHFLQAAREVGGDKEVLVRIGDFYFYGWAEVQASPEEALRWYSCASAAGVEAGAYNVGHMHEYGLGVPVNYERAERYYKRVLELAPASAVDRHVAGHLALLRLRLRKWAAQIGLSRSDDGRSGDFGGARAVVAVSTVLAVVSMGVWVVRQQRLASI